jgi:FkbM family methyltransferase
MIDKIKDIPNQKLIDLKYLQNSTLPLLLFGIGSYAIDVKKFLDANNVNIDHIVLDKNYYKPGLYFLDFPVELIDNVITRYKKTNILIAFSKYREKAIEYSLNQNIARCIFIDAPNEDCFFDYEFIKTHNSEFQKIYISLEDDYSRDVLIAFINAKISGCPGELYDLNVKEEEQYFPSFNNLLDNEIFVDCGAFDGDTIKLFYEKTNGKYDKIYAFECDIENIKKLRNTTSKYKNIEIIGKGCYSEKTSLTFSNNGTGTSMIIKNDIDCGLGWGGGGVIIDTDTIDNVVKSKPKLAISVYHKPEDLITIPEYIISLNKNYKLFLRHYGYNSWETILYAIPDFLQERL